MSFAQVLEELPRWRSNNASFWSVARSNWTISHCRKEMKRSSKRGWRNVKGRGWRLTGPSLRLRVARLQRGWLSPDDLFGYL